MEMNYIRLIALAAILTIPVVQAADDEPSTIISKPSGKGPVKWADYLVDSGAGSVSAAGMLGVSGESITTVENVRDAVVALKGLDSNGSKATLALSVTPARTELLPISYTTYAQGGFSGAAARLWGAFTVGYAQGDADVSGAKFERRAVSAETSFFFDADKDDPVLVFANSLAKKYTIQLDDNGDQLPLDPCDTRNDPDVVAAGGKDIEPLEGDDPSTVSDSIFNKNPSAAALQKAQQKVRNACYKNMKANLRWNRSRASIAYATGWIKGKDGAIDERSLGHTVAASVSYGIGDDPKKNAWLIGVTYRQSFDEPVLATLGTATVNEKDTSLVVGQIKYGSQKIRAMLEASNARSDDITASQRAFRQAVGVDFRLMENTWLNFRYGIQREVDGDGDEKGSLLTLSYSPTALLQ